MHEFESTYHEMSLEKLSLLGNVTHVLGLAPSLCAIFGDIKRLELMVGPDVFCKLNHWIAWNKSTWITGLGSKRSSNEKTEVSKRYC